MKGEKNMAIRDPGRESGGTSGKFSYEIVKRIGVLAKYPTGWTKELNLISWNGSKPKYDIRDWDEKHESMSRGVTLHPNEAEKLYKILNELEHSGNEEPIEIFEELEEVAAAV